MARDLTITIPTSKLDRVVAAYAARFDDDVTRAKVEKYLRSVIIADVKRHEIEEARRIASQVSFNLNE